MSREDLIQIKRLLMDLRFIQAAALVGAQLSDDKNAIAYMRTITRMEKAVETELAREVSHG